MADEPERRVVGAILVELEKQRHDGINKGLYPWLYLEPVQPDGTILIEGTLDLYLLARAVMDEIKENPV